MDSGAPMKPSSLSAILLAYQEEGALRDSVDRLRSALERLTDDWEILLVCYEGARDRTNEIALRLGEEDPRVRRILQRRDETGYGRALALGLRAAAKDWVFQSDADGQFDFSELGLLLERAQGDVALVHGWRRERRDPPERRLLAWGYNAALSLLFRVGVRDVDSAFKLMRRSAIEDLELRSASGFGVAELVIRLRRKERRVVQCPVSHRPRLSGRALSDKGFGRGLGLELPNAALAAQTLREMLAFRWRG
jgi:glycosyltransferase involved in cell wall biosynthesis